MKKYGHLFPNFGVFYGVRIPRRRRKQLRIAYLQQQGIKQDDAIWDSLQVFFGCSTWHLKNDYRTHKLGLSSSTLVVPLDVATPCDHYAQDE